MVVFTCFHPKRIVLSPSSPSSHLSKIKKNRTTKSLGHFCRPSFCPAVPSPQFSPLQSEKMKIWSMPCFRSSGVFQQAQLIFKNQAFRACYGHIVPLCYGPGNQVVFHGYCLVVKAFKKQHPLESGSPSRSRHFTLL